MLNEPIRYEAIRVVDADGQSASQPRTIHPQVWLAATLTLSHSLIIYLLFLALLATCCGCCVWASGLALIVACNGGGAVATDRTSPTHLCLRNKSPYRTTSSLCFDHSKRCDVLVSFVFNVYFFERASFFLELWFSCCLLLHLWCHAIPYPDWRHVLVRLLQDRIRYVCLRTEKNKITNVITYDRIERQQHILQSCCDTLRRIGWRDFFQIHSSKRYRYMSYIGKRVSIETSENIFILSDRLFYGPYI